MNHSQHKQSLSSSTSFKASVPVRSHSPKLSVHHGISHFSHHGGYHKVHHTAHNTHGGSSKPIMFSKHSSFPHGYGYGNVHGVHNNDSHFNSIGSHSSWKNDGFLNVNEKETMQLLNDRLATYLEKVRSLEQENAQMEKKICEWHEKNVHSSMPDFQHYYKTIEELQNKISATSLDNARLVLEIDNARLATDDFKNKYELEIRLRTFVENDLKGLRMVLEGLNIERGDLQVQLECLQDEVLQMKKHHEEDVSSLRNQLGSRINVHVDAAPSVDLNRVLCEVREQYENMMEKNLKEVESIFILRSEELNRQMASGSEQLQSVQTDLIDLKRCLQTLEIELQSQLSMKSALECTLAETEATFGSQLIQLQSLIDNVEDQLSQVRSELERQMYEYKILMDQTTRLEMEISTYKKLMEADIHVPEHHPIHQEKIYKEISHGSSKHISTQEYDHGKGGHQTKEPSH
ncbi:PREDICTED: keratin, type I cuticular Ha4-like [Nanorana parkeri]|uniref:keratin, type I cuticular Ha4-like n=1 Tax=Nanorana parkeri TaxID=125878 RepID=UPI0008550A54|nr:PREDICTED: keratin, type I cuticular Ha4-like [Nanorana parkeri]